MTEEEILQELARRASMIGEFPHPDLVTTLVDEAEELVERLSEVIGESDLTGSGGKA